jgi:hypothetical protein
VVRGGRLDIEMGDECRLRAARRPARGDHPRAGRIPAAERPGSPFFSYGFCSSQPEAATATHLPSHPLTSSTENA